MNVALNIVVNCKHWSPGDRPPTGNCRAGVKDRPSPGACHACTEREPATPYVDLILKNTQGAGDQVLLTAVVRDLHRAYPDRYRTAVDCWGTDLFANNPLITPREKLKDPKLIVCEGFEASDDQPHLVRQFARGLGRQLGVGIEPVKLGGDVRLSRAEVSEPHPFDGEPYWLAWFGGHWGFTTKLWNPRSAQAVVDHFAGRLRFVQVGDRGHFHPELRNTTYLVGKTPMRRMVMLMRHAGGGIGPVSFGMHLAAAVPTLPGQPTRRPFVVLVGGREAPQVFQYPGHVAIGSIGRYRCCRAGACWKNNSMGGAGRVVDCEQTRQVAYGDDQRVTLARCMAEGVSAARVIEAIEGYLEAEQEAADHAHRQQLEAWSVAEKTKPFCANCQNLSHFSPGGLVAYCKSTKACKSCGHGEAPGGVSLTQKCPEGKWDAAELTGARRVAVA